MNILAFPIALTVVLSIIGLCILTCIFFIAYFNIKKKKQDKHVLAMKEIINKNKKEYFQNCLNRLKNVSDKNEQYKDIYQSMESKFEYIFTTIKDTLDYKQDELQKECNEERYSKKLTQDIKNLDAQIAEYKKALEDLENEFYKIFNAGDRLRVKANELKSKLISTKNDIEKYEASLQTCIEALKEYMEATDECFEQFDELMSCAKYEKAQEVLEVAEKRVFNVYSNVERMADYNNMVLDIIPNKLEQLISKKNELEEDGYVVNHTHIEDFVELSKQALASLEQQFSCLCFGDYEEITKQIQDKIDEAYAKLDKEVSNKNELEERYPSIEEKLSLVESEFIGYKRLFTEVTEYYQLSTEICDRFNEYVNKSAELSNMKREYEGYLFVDTRFPASYLLEKADKMEKLADEIMSEINFFNNYFTDIKHDVETIYETSHELEVTLVKTLGNIRFNKAYPVYKKYRDDVDILLDELNNINRLLKETPIQIGYIHDEFNRIHDRVNDIRQKMVNDMNSYSLFERSLIFANSLRHSFKEVDKTLKLAESLFINGNYKEAQDKVNHVLNNYHSDAFDSFEEEGN